MMRFLPLLLVVIFACKKSNETDGSPKAPRERTQFSVKVDEQKLLGLLAGKATGRTLMDSTTLFTNLSANLDTLGQWHNDLMGLVLSKLESGDLPMCDTGEFRENFNTLLHGFFASKGATTSGDFIDFYLTSLDGTTLGPQTGLSTAANLYMDTLKTLVDSIDFNNLSAFQTACNSLKNNSIGSLSSNGEKVVVGGTIALAKYSAVYWGANFDDWENHFKGVNCSPDPKDRQAPASGPNPKQISVLQHDAAGAISGGLGGLAGGPVTGFLGALIGGGVKSAIHGVCQGFNITHITNWFGL